MTPAWWRNFADGRITRSERYANRVILAIGIGVAIGFAAGWL